MFGSVRDKFIVRHLHCCQIITVIISWCLFYCIATFVQQLSKLKDLLDKVEELETTNAYLMQRLVSIICQLAYFVFISTKTYEI